MRKQRVTNCSGRSLIPTIVDNQLFFEEMHEIVFVVVGFTARAEFLKKKRI
jgi:hypothetical protein